MNAATVILWCLAGWLLFLIGVALALIQLAQP